MISLQYEVLIKCCLFISMNYLCPHFSLYFRITNVCSSFYFANHFRTYSVISLFGEILLVLSYSHLCLTISLFDLVHSSFLWSRSFTCLFPRSIVCLFICCIFFYLFIWICFVLFISCCFLLFWSFYLFYLSLFIIFDIIWHARPSRAPRLQPRW